MARSRPARTSFVAGEWSPLLHGRFDLQKYIQAAALIENWIVQPQGGITRRPGSHFVALAKAVDYDPILLPFQFGVSQSYVLEAGEFYARFFTLQGQLIAPQVTAGITNGDFAAGMTGWIDTSVSGGDASVTNGDVLVEGGVGTPVGTMTAGGGLSAPFGGINTANFFAYHRLVLTGGDTTFGIGISRVIFYEGNQVIIDPVTGTPLGNLTANPPSNNAGPYQAIKNIPWTNAAQSAGTPAITGMHWSFRTHKITGFQVYGSSDKGFKFENDPDITVELQGSTDNFVTSIVSLATIVHHSASNIPSMVQLFSDDIPGEWVNCARSVASPASIGKHWTSPKTITGFVVRGSDDHGFKKGENPQIVFTLQGSNDNFATTTDLATAKVNDVTGSISASVRRRVVTGSYAYHRILMAGGLTNNGFAVKQVTFYEAASDVGRMQLTPGAGTAAVDQSITIPSDELGEPHLLTFRVFADQGDECTVRVGSASDLFDFSGSPMRVGDGNHTISFLPTSSPAVLQFRSLGDAVVEIDDVALLSDQPYEIQTPFTRDELEELSVAQAADVMWIAHEHHQLQQLIRHGHTSWELRTANLKDGPYKDVNLDESIVITPSAASGAAITLTASEELFKPGHIGSMWRIGAPGGVPGCKTWESNVAVTLGEHRKFGRNVYKAVGAGTTGNSPPTHERGTVSDGVVSWTFRNQDGWGYVLITGYTSPTVVTARVKVLLDIGVTAGTSVWREGAFSDYRGWPAVVALVGDRMLLARGIEFYLSSTGIFDDFTPTGDDDGAIYGQLSGSIGAPIRWAVGQQRIVIGTEAGPWVLRSSSEDEALTPKNIQSRQQNSAGSSPSTGFQAEGAVVYFSRSDRRMYELVPAVDQTGGIGYRGTDLTILGSRVLGPGAVRGQLAREPQSIVWVLREDGQLATLTYSQAEAVTAWSRQLLGGRVASHAIIPGANDSQALDEIWLCVERDVAGGNRYIEFLISNIGAEADAPEDSFYVDCGVSSDPTQPVGITPSAEALVAGNTDVLFIAAAPLWAADDVGKLIRRTRSTGLAEITGYINSTSVLCEVIRAFDTSDQIPATQWGMSSMAFTGLDHLEQATVKVLADGAEHPDCVVDDGSITLTKQAFEVTVGIGIISRHEGLSIPEGGQAGSSTGAPKRTSKVIVGMVNSDDFEIGFITDNGREEYLETVILRRAEEGISFTPPELATGITEPIGLNVPHDLNPRLLILCDGVRPATVTHVVFSDLSVEELS